MTVGDLHDIRVAAVVLIQEQRVACRLSRRLEGGVAPMAEPVFLQPAGPQPGGGPGSRLLARQELGDVRQLHRVADDQSPFGPEQERQDIQRRALTRLINDHQVEHRRPVAEPAGRPGGDRPDRDVRQRPVQCRPFTRRASSDGFDPLQDRGPSAHRPVRHESMQQRVRGLLNKPPGVRGTGGEIRVLRACVRCRALRPPHRLVLGKAEQRRELGALTDVHGKR